jgi:hypothetical protein
MIDDGRTMGEMTIAERAATIADMALRAERRGKPGQSAMFQKLGLETLGPLGSISELKRELRAAMIEGRHAQTPTPDPQPDSVGIQITPQTEDNRVQNNTDAPSGEEL